MKLLLKQILPCRRFKGTNGGFAMIETIFLLFLFSLMGLGISHSTIMFMGARARAYRTSLCNQLAMEAVEEFAAIDPTTLDDSDDSTTTIEWDDLEFEQTVNITVNGDDSRTVNVAVVSLNDKFEGRAEIMTTLSLWGSK